MRVALAFPGCHRRGGVERVLVECANFLHARKHDVVVCASEWDEGVLSTGIHTLNVELPRGSNARLLAFPGRCSSVLAKLQPAPSVLAGFGAVSPPGSVAWVQSVHKTWLEIAAVKADLRSRLRRRLNPAHGVILGLERRYYGRRQYKKLVALTEQVKQDLIRSYSVPPQDIVTLPNGFSPAEFSLERRLAMREAMRAKLGYSPDDFVVIFVANELHRKGFIPLLKATAALRDSRIKLLAVGKLQASSCQAEISSLGMTRRVQFAGPSGTVADYYAAADLFALPTTYEAWGLVIVEAMACGLPVLTSRLAGASTLVNVPAAGRLLDDPRSVDEITAGLRDLILGHHSDASEIADSVGSNAWDCVLPRYEQILLDCAASAPHYVNSGSAACT